MTEGVSLGLIHGLLLIGDQIDKRGVNAFKDLSPLTTRQSGGFTRSVIFGKGDDFTLHSSIFSPKIGENIDVLPINIGSVFFKLQTMTIQNFLFFDDPLFVHGNKLWGVGDEQTFLRA
ncbi:hypothetical protein F11_07250 [Rhodospirillum rubrum F11]|nr:hypothetical protein F11_07250 [Rhodospirillum rubrum F11]